MRKAFTLSLVFVSVLVTQAQHPLNRMQESENFYDIQAYYEQLFKKFEGRTVDVKDEEGVETETAEDNVWMLFNRWKNFYEPRLYPSGQMDYEQRIFSFYQKQKNNNSGLRDYGSDENWSIIGPSSVPVNGGIGRINSLAFNPNDSNIIWVGTPAGGLWKSTDAGATWTTNTDLFPVLGISDIAIDPSNTNIMYIGTGDRDAGDTRSLGILKSIDGGTTWNTTGLSFTTYDYAAVYRILIYPDQPSILVAATNYGVFKSSDAGSTWVQTFAGYMRDLNFKEGNDSVIFACSGNRFYSSSNVGSTWNQYSSGLPISTSGRMKIATTAANPETVYILSADNVNWAYNGVYRSINGGVNWTMMSDTPNLMGWDVYGGDTGGQGWYTLSITASPTDENVIYVGGVDIWKSNDSGTTWSIVAHWYGDQGTPYVHADIHYLYASDANTVYTVCDGGIFITDNSGGSWTDKSSNMAISQFYRFSNSATNANEIIGGTQDNGTSLLKNGTWKEVYGGDGMEALIDFADPDNMYAEYQFGFIGRSFDGGQNFVGIWPGDGGAWITPYIIDPNNHKHLIYGDENVWQTFNYGDTWAQHTNDISGGEQFQSLAIAPSNSSVIYAATYYQFFKTTDGGNTWIKMNPFLPLGLPAITYMAVKNTDENTLWITCSGFTDGQKVFESHDGGYSWENISGGLPNLPVDCIVYKNGSDYNELYVGTDIGVYYKEDYLSHWVAVNNALPNVIVDELEIQYSSGKLRAATYGRGIWETNLVTPIMFMQDASVTSIVSPEGFVCTTSIDPVVQIKNYGLDTIHTVEINFSIDNGANNVYNFAGTIPPLAIANVTLPSQPVTPGSHIFRAYTNLPNNLADNFPANDKDSASYKFTPAGIVPVNEGFQNAGLPVDWEIQNPDASYTWIKTNTGAFGLSDSCLAIIFFDYPAIGQLDQFVSPEFDLSSFVAYANLSFDIANCRYSVDYSDSLFVLVSNDCGNSWTRVYSKGGESLASAPDYTGWFFPSAYQWRHEEVDLSAYIGQKILLSFETRNGYGNNLYLDNINLIDQPLSIDESTNANAFIVYPNPASNVVYVETKSSFNNSELEVVNALGQQVYQNAQFTKSRIVLDVSFLPEGIYWVVLKTEEGISKQMLVLQR